MIEKRSASPLHRDWVEQRGRTLSRRQFILTSVSAVALAGQVTRVFSENLKYPEKPVRIIVPLSAGSSGDVRVRLLAEKLSARLGQRFVIENKPGAGLTLGTMLVANSKPDGYTLLATFTPSFTVAPFVYKNATYDPQKSFTPVASFARASPLFAVHPAVPAKTIKEFVALAQSQPGTLTVGHSGVGAGIHLPSELFRRAAKIDFIYVPYKSESLAFPDLVGGQISAMFVYTGGGVPLITAGKIRALAVAAATRNSAVPNVPTFIEEGYPSVEFYVHGLLLGPTGMPKDVALALHRELATIMKEPDVVRSYESTGAEPFVGSAEEAMALIQHELDTSAALVKELGVTLE